MNLRNKIKLKISSNFTFFSFNNFSINLLLKSTFLIVISTEKISCNVLWMNILLNIILILSVCSGLIFINSHSLVFYIKLL